MKKIVNFILMMATVSFTSLAACTVSNDTVPIQKKGAWLRPDSLAYSQLGRNLSTILFSSSKVECYPLIYKEKPEEGDVEVEKHFVRGESLGFLKADQLAVMRYILIAPAESYQKDSIRVRAPYAPAMEFVFHHKKMKQDAQIVLSPNDFTWTLFYDDKRQFHFNFTNKEAVVRFYQSMLDYSNQTSPQYKNKDNH